MNRTIKPSMTSHAYPNSPCRANSQAMDFCRKKWATLRFDFRSDFSSLHRVGITYLALFTTRVTHART